MKVYYFVIGVAGIGVNIWASVYYPHISWFPVTVMSFVSGSLISASGLLSRKRRQAREVLPISHRQCTWCGFTAQPLEVLVHEMTEHKA